MTCRNCRKALMIRFYKRRNMPLNSLQGGYVAILQLLPLHSCACLLVLLVRSCCAYFNSPSTP